MDRRTFCSALSSLPFAGILAASPRIAGPKTIIYVHEFILTQQIVAVFDLDGKTYGLRMSDEYMKDVQDIHSVDPLELVVRFVETVTGGSAGVQKRVGALPEFIDAKCVFSKYYILPDETMEKDVRYRRLSPDDKYMCYFKVSIEAGNHFVFWYV